LDVISHSRPACGDGQHPTEIIALWQALEQRMVELGYQEASLLGLSLFIAD
jgi:hypothetical protein